MNSSISFDDLSALGISSSAKAPPAAANENDLAQDDFLTLMITQFQNQDPFKPLENGEFLGQLAQFGTVSGIDELKSSFSSVAESIYSDQALQASGMIGRTVLADIDAGYLAESGPLSGAVDVPASSAAVEVEITDGAGQVVRTLELGQQPAGLADFSWDGRLADGARAAPGQYTVTARALGAEGYEAVPTLISAQVESVSLAPNTGSLSLNVDGLNALSMGQVRQIT